jgi:hypothetical protein
MYGIFSATRDFRPQVFFLDQFLLGFRVSHWGHFEFLLKFAEILAALCGYRAGVVVTDDKLSPVSLKPVFIIFEVNSNYGALVILENSFLFRQFMRGNRRDSTVCMTHPTTNQTA